MNRLSLVHIADDTQPAAFYELAAARYIGLCRPYFRQLIMSGVIPYRQHLGRKRRIYLRADLDAYLCSLKKRTMTIRENPLKALKEAK